MWIQPQEFFCSHTISKLTNWKWTPSCWWRCRVRFSKHVADPSELLFVCWWTPSFTMASAMMNAPHFFQEATAHKEIPTSPTVMGPDQNQFRPLMAQILTGFFGEPISATFYNSLRKRLVSQDWRKAIVCPTFIKGTHGMRPFAALWVSLLVYMLKRPLFWLRHNLFTEPTWLPSRRSCLTH